MEKKKTWKIPCAGKKEYGCEEIIEVTSLKQWYCKKCLKLRNNNIAIARYKNKKNICEVIER